MPITVPEGLPAAEALKKENIFTMDRKRATAVMKWRGHASTFFSNWLNYFVHQQTPYHLTDLQEQED